MATLIEPNGRRTEMKPANPKRGFELAELQKLVGGYIECAHFGNEGKFFVVNEEGKLLGLPYNEEATKIYAEHHPNDYIVGNALLCERGEVR
jgi:hypothetical protein